MKTVFPHFRFFASFICASNSFAYRIKTKIKQKNVEKYIKVIFIANGDEMSKKKCHKEYFVDISQRSKGNLNEVKWKFKVNFQRVFSLYSMRIIQIKPKNTNDQVLRTIGCDKSSEFYLLNFFFTLKQNTQKQGRKAFHFVNKPFFSLSLPLAKSMQQI